MSRLTNMADPGEVSMLHQMRARDAARVRAVLDDVKAVDCLRYLFDRGHTSSAVYGAFDQIVRTSKGSLRMPLDQTRSDVPLPPSLIEGDGGGVYCSRCEMLDCEWLDICPYSPVVVRRSALESKKTREG